MPTLSEVIRDTDDELSRRGRIDYGKFSRLYLKQIPRHIAERSEGALLLHQFQQQLSSGVLTADTIQEALSISEKTDPRRRRAFLETALPLMLSLTSLQRLENHPGSFKRAIIALSEGVAAGRLNFMSPLCPPYNYKADQNGLISHADGTIHPTVGSRFIPVLETIAQPLAALVETGVEIDFLFATYSGRTGDRNDMVEMGAETLQHYAGNEPELLGRLQLAFGEMEQQANTVFGGYGIGSECIGLDEQFGPEINQQVAALAPEVTRLMEPSHLFEFRRDEIERGLSSLGLTVTADMLRSFVEEESHYRLGHSNLIDSGKAEPVLVTALKQSMLYDRMLQLAASRGAIIWNLENASSYMGRSLALGNYEVPVLMARPYDPRIPNYPFNIRQPFNPPVVE